jgi:hypothetical protein
MEALAVSLNKVNKVWSKPDDRVFGHILRSPAITLGVGQHRFTEDWGIFLVNRDKLGTKTPRWTSQVRQRRQTQPLAEPSFLSTGGGPSYCPREGFEAGLGPVQRPAPPWF